MWLYWVVGGHSHNHRLILEHAPDINICLFKSDQVFIKRQTFPKKAARYRTSVELKDIGMCGIKIKFGLVPACGSIAALSWGRLSLWLALMLMHRKFKHCVGLHQIYNILPSRQTRDSFLKIFESYKHSEVWYWANGDTRQSGGHAILKLFLKKYLLSILQEFHTSTQYIHITSHSPSPSLTSLGPFTTLSTSCPPFFVNFGPSESSYLLPVYAWVWGHSSEHSLS